MGTLLLVRHGQEAWSEDTDDLLSPLGWEQGRMLGTALAARGVVPDLVVRGAARRHRETAEAIGEAAGWAGREVVDPRWDEFDHVDVLRDHLPTMVGGADPEPQQFQQWLTLAMARWTGGEHDADYAESFDGFARRTQSALADAADRVGRGGTVVVVSSGGPIAWLTAAMVAMWSPGEDPRGYAGAWGRLNSVVVNTSVTKVTVGLRGVRLVSFNEHSHLECGPSGE